MRYLVVLTVFRRVIGHTVRYLQRKGLYQRNFDRITDPVSAPARIIAFLPQITDPVSANPRRVSVRPAPTQARAEYRFDQHHTNPRRASVGWAARTKAREEHVSL